MARDEQLKSRWEHICRESSKTFGNGEILDVDDIIYLVGLQEFGKFHRKFKKDDKINLMHIAICKLLEPYGYYRFDFVDPDGWPHYTLVEELPPLKAGEQSILMKEAIVHYFEKNGFFD